MDFEQIVKVSGVVTQGRNDQQEWVKTFRVKYDTNPDCSGEATMEYIMESDGSNTPKVNLTENIMFSYLTLMPWEYCDCYITITWLSLFDLSY